MGTFLVYCFIKLSDAVGIMKKSILIVDDNDLNREVIVDILEPQGFQLDEAEDGAQAVAMVTDKDYDLVLMDIMMPVMDGVEATRQIRNLRGFEEPPRIVAVTAKKLDGNAGKWAGAGFNDFVGKPFDEADLNRVLSID